MNLLKDLSELIMEGIIDEPTADRIREYYNRRKGPSTNRLFVIFGILGAVLVGLGIVLIVAHNWDEFSRTAKTILAFVPLLIGQFLAGFSLLRYPNSIAWREGSSAFLFLAIGACISMVSQIYNIPGSVSTYLLTWMLLSVPLLYVMRSSITSLFYLIGITYYGCEAGYWTYPFSQAYYYWGLLFLALPHYYLLYRRKPESNFMTFHNWIVPLSVLITLGTVSEGQEDLMFIAYFSLFGLFYLLGQSPYFTGQKLRNNGYLILGSLGTVILLLFVSFGEFWRRRRDAPVLDTSLFLAPEFWASALLTLAAVGLLFYQWRTSKPYAFRPTGYVFLLYLIAYFIGMHTPYVSILINVYVLVMGLLIIREGARADNLGTLNYGLLIIAALVACRFFDSDLSFVLRGILFVAVGAGFFAANYWMLKKRKGHEE